MLNAHFSFCSVFLDQRKVAQKEWWMYSLISYTLVISFETSETKNTDYIIILILFIRVSCALMHYQCFKLNFKLAHFI